MKTIKPKQKEPELTFWEQRERCRELAEMDNQSPLDWSEHEHFIE